MASNPSPDLCPYKGLQPFTEKDQAYFFGRERDQEIISSNLYAASLTVLYGVSGVGKSSVLMAGVIPQLRQTPRLAVVLFRTWQDEAFLSVLKTQVLNAVNQIAGHPVTVDLNLPLDDFLQQCCAALHGNVFLILDQFEEYFLYHDSESGATGFDTEFARAVNRRDVPASFLVSLREDGLSKLDRFKGRMPNLLSNLLRLEHLDDEAAHNAITKPLEEYNRHLGPGQTPMSIEPALVDAVIDQVRTGHLSLGETGTGLAGQSHGADQSRVETPYLQLVLMRLWEEERKANSNTLRLATLQKLGGAEKIVQKHLDNTLAQFSTSERLMAANAFRYLVTPSGTKIAWTAQDLANYINVPPAKLSPVLVKLTGSDVRLLRAVEAPGGKEPRFEIFHDVLAPAVLEWQERYLRGIQRRNALLRTGTALAIALLVMIALAADLLFIENQNSRIRSLNEQNQKLLESTQKNNKELLQVLGRATLGAQAQATLADVRATAVVLSTEQVQAQQAAAQFTAPTATPLVSPTRTPEPTGTPTASATAAATATATPLTATSVPMTPSPMPPQGPPVVAIAALTWNPLEIHHNTDVVFQVTFRNTFPTAQKKSWAIWIYQNDNPRQPFWVSGTITSDLPVGDTVVDTQSVDPFRVRGRGGLVSFTIYVKDPTQDNANVQDLNGNDLSASMTVLP